jgi:NAD(P)-dependent dehydrogenase (short-subunit alcohol dehydrogenase family)
MSNLEVSVLLGTGAIGLAVARRVNTGHHVLLADLNKENAEAAADKFKQDGVEVSTAVVDVTSQKSVEELATRAKDLGQVKQVIIATGVSPSNAPSNVILKVDLLGVAYVLETFGDVIAPGGAALVIGSQAGHRLKALSAEEDQLISKTPANDLLKLEIFNSQASKDSLYAYQLAKRGSSLRVKYEAVRWGKRQARVNMISPGIVMTPLAEAELKSQNAEQYKSMIEKCPTNRAGKPEEVAALASVLMGSDGGFITGSDFLMDGGVTAAYWFGELNSLK